jgi:hypothetical protein
VSRKQTKEEIKTNKEKEKEKKYYFRASKWVSPKIPSRKMGLPLWSN